MLSWIAVVFYIFSRYRKTNYNKLSISQIWEAAQKIYAEYPELLKAAAQTLGLE